MIFSRARGRPSTSALASAQVARLCDKSPVPGHDFVSSALAIIGVPMDGTPWADHASESLAKVAGFPVIR